MITQSREGLLSGIHFNVYHGLEDIAPDGDRHTALRERHFSRFEMERLREPSFFPVGEWAQFETSQFQHRVVLVESARLGNVETDGPLWVTPYVEPHTTSTYRHRTCRIHRGRAPRVWSRLTKFELVSCAGGLDERTGKEGEEQKQTFHRCDGIYGVMGDKGCYFDQRSYKTYCQENLRCSW